MFPLWATVIEPVIRALDAKRIVEIGALRGETTVQVLNALGPEAELHVIDPAPEFDPVDHERRFGGRYIFHQDLSVKALPHMPPCDVALIDGDHNWYTVHSELALLAESAHRHGTPLPVLVLHDVLWPYGRRDMYYDPSTIPEQHRQPFDRRGMRPGRSALLDIGGLNVNLCNAVEEGGPRNGVLTALEDFMAEHDQPLRLVMVPICFGLAIVAEEALLAQRPQVATVLDRLESLEGARELLELSERIRLDAAVFQHNIDRVRDERQVRAARRYLDLLRSALLDEHYLENEVRINYLLDRAAKRRVPQHDVLRAPARFSHKEYHELRQARIDGTSSAWSGRSPVFPYTAMGRVLLDHLDGSLATILDEDITGDLVECGVGRGGGAIYMRGFLEAYEDTDRSVWVADHFRSTREPLRALNEGGIADLLADLDDVQHGFERFGLLNERVRFLQGPFDATLPDAPIGAIALLRIGAGVGPAADVVLENLYGRISGGGYVIVEHEADPECLAAIDAFRARRGIEDPVDRVGWLGRAWRKSDGSHALVVPAPVQVRARPPLAPPVPPDAIDLSVIVVVYEMPREAQRTLHSLSRAYQRGVDEVDYEVIVIENGTRKARRLGEDLVRSFGPEFRYVALDEEATPSPTAALNLGIRIARGRNFALMIDGAHLLTPGVFRFGMLGLQAYAPAIVAVQQWYVGPGQQPDTVMAGYDRSREDALFHAINWPTDGYRLFEISHFVGDRDWLDYIIESNCLFAPRSLLEQLGCFDDSFSEPGGGYANLDIYERLAAGPGVTIVSMLGEGSFHQFHGGTTTNDADQGDRHAKIRSYSDQYRDLRGRIYRSPPKAPHYVGALATSQSRRTRSRRMTADAFATERIDRGVDGVPSEPEPIPDELRTAFIEAFWRGLAWQDTTWLGTKVALAPTDLIVYQELLTNIRPDYIVETRSGDGVGRALFLASICELLGSGHVISVGDGPTQSRPEHPRIMYVDVRSDDPEAALRVRAFIGEHANALVILGARLGAADTVREFGHFSPFVSVGSYVIVEDTIVNGHPVWPGYGPGPNEAITRILDQFRDFRQDTSVEKFALTFNAGGYLKRVAGGDG